MQNDELRRKYSGEFNVTQDTPPIFMVHADNDSVKPENSFVFYQALRKQGRSVEMHIVSKGNHGFFDKKGWGIPSNKALRFSRAGGMWPVWTLNWLLEEKLVDDPGAWVWTQHRAAIKAIVDP